MTSLRQALARPVDTAWLGALRVLFGTAMCISMVRFIAYGWIDSFFVDPKFHFKYYGFGWLEPLPRVGMHALFWVLAALAFMVAVGVWFRAAAVLFVLGFTYLQLIDVTTYLNHYYLASLVGLLLAIAPADRWGSVRALRDAGHTRQQIPALWLFLFRFQVGVVYTFAGLAKAHGDWLLHAQPLSIWLSSRTDVPVLGALFPMEGVPMLMSWAGFLFDTSIPWLLSIRRVRPFAYALVIGFHAITGLLFPIGMFPVIMVMSALVFFEPSWPRRILRQLRLDAGEERASDFALGRSLVPSWAVLALALYCAFQLAMPLRFLAYGGNVRWHEQGMRFSWRVMVREKNGAITFKVTRKDTGRTWYVSPHKYLTQLQEREMSSQPDLILQLAHHIRDDYRRRGVGDVEVRADAVVSLNGRPARRLIDPDVDLAAVADGWAKAHWILPAPQDAPPPIRPLPHAGALSVL